jgi:hypothetical protein
MKEPLTAINQLLTLLDSEFNTKFSNFLIIIFGYDRFMRTVNFCKTNVPQFLSDSIEPIKNDDEKVREFGVEFGIKQC